ncbi:MAG: rod shape-determining protein MreC [Rhodobacteraceae bacterium]|nr:MAG: rod shape-determining protein MreC [Paracoccaceae bacterium]
MLAREQDAAWKAVRRFLLIGLIIGLVSLFGLWRVENQRLERFRNALTDEILPKTNFLLKPITISYQILSDFKSYTKLYQQNQDLKNELQKMEGWKEAALQLEQKNAQLSLLNNVKLDLTINWVTGQVVADSGSPFNQSVLLNIGSQDGVQDGAAAIGGLGLVGRVSGVGQNTSRVILLTDVSSSIPVVVQKTGKSALLNGDNSLNPILNFLEDKRAIRPGMRVFTSGEGKVFPKDLLIGTIVLDTSGQLRVNLAAELEELNYLRILFKNTVDNLKKPGSLILK